MCMIFRNAAVENIASVGVNVVHLSTAVAVASLGVEVDSILVAGVGMSVNGERAGTISRAVSVLCRNAACRIDSSSAGDCLIGVLIPSSLNI